MFFSLNYSLVFIIRSLTLIPSSMHASMTDGSVVYITYVFPSVGDLYESLSGLSIFYGTGA